jgi:phosphoribosylanthranilate isomerase
MADPCKVKFCGMTNLDDCLAAIDLGVDFIGFVFYRRSARYISPRTVRSITARIPGQAKTVGVFVEETEEKTGELLDFCGLDYAQVYTPMKGIVNAISVHRIKDRAPDVDEGGLVLFDSHTEDFGGSGASFDFSVLKGHSVLNRAFVAGGIGEHNIYRVLRLDPFGIDLVSSVEAEKGKKDRAKMKRLINMVRSFEL